MNQSNLPDLEREFEAKDNKKYKIKSIIGNMVYNKEAENQLLNFYYLVL